MNKSKAQKFVTKAKSFGTLDFALLNKHIQPLPVQKGGGFSVTPMMIVVGVGFILNHSWNPVRMQVTTGGAYLLSLDIHSQGSDQTNTSLQVS